MNLQNSILGSVKLWFFISILLGLLLVLSFLNRGSLFTSVINYSGQNVELPNEYAGYDYILEDDGTVHLR